MRCPCIPTAPRAPCLTPALIPLSTMSLQAGDAQVPSAAANRPVGLPRPHTVPCPCWDLPALRGAHGHPTELHRVQGAPAPVPAWRPMLISCHGRVPQSHSSLLLTSPDTAPEVQPCSTCKDPIPEGSPRARQILLSQPPAFPLALCFLRKGMQDLLQVHICSQGQHWTLTPRFLPGPHPAQHCGVASEPTNPCLTTTPPSGAPQPGATAPSRVCKAEGLSQPFLLFSCPLERTSSAREDEAAVGTRMDTGSAQEELQAAQLCSLSKAPTARGLKD